MRLPISMADSATIRFPSTSPLSRCKRTLPALLIAGALALGTAHAGDASLHPLMVQNHVPAAVVSGQATNVQALDSAKVMHFNVALPLSNEQALDNLLSQIYDPSSPQYHHYLKPQEFTQRFEPSQANYDKVVAWAKAHNLSVTATTSNRHLIDLQGAVGDINRALHLTMRQYQHPTENRLFHAPDREPTVDLDVPLLHIGGLDNYARPISRLRHQPDQARTTKAVPAGSGPQGNFLPSDMRSAYYGSGSLTGKGQVAAIFSFDGYLTSDLSLFYTDTNTSDPGVPVSNVLVNNFNGACTNPSASNSSSASTCNDGEQILDIVNLAGMAPGLQQILFYEGSNPTDILNQIASDDKASVISNSWGARSFDSSDDTIYKEFQVQGQTFVNASGDDGSYTSKDWLPPSLDPYITDVGATDLTTNGAGGAWTSETAWSYSSGGYLKQAGYSLPSYQKLSSVINKSNMGSTSYRNDPDIAMEGNYDNVTISNGSLITNEGGTSYAAPRLAGLIALADEQATNNGGSNVGFLNTTLYNLGTGPNYAKVFHDITSGSNGGFNAVTGYDLVTGWGSPIGPAFITALAPASSNASSSASSVTTNADPASR